MYGPDLDPAVVSGIQFVAGFPLRVWNTSATHHRDSVVIRHGWTRDLIGQVMHEAALLGGPIEQLSSRQYLAVIASGNHDPRI